MKDLSVNFAGLSLENPLIIASGPCSENVYRIKKMEKMGIGAIITKTLALEGAFTYEVRNGRYPHCIPHYQKMIKPKGSIYTQSHPCDVPAKKWCDRIKKLKSEMKIPLIASLESSTIEGYVKMARMVNDVGVDAIELNISVPPLAAMEKGDEANFLAWTGDSEKYIRLIKRIKDVTSIPVGTKLGTTFYGTRLIANTVKTMDTPVEFLTIMNSPYGGAGVDLESLKPDSTDGGMVAMLSGSILKNIALGMIAVVGEVIDYKKIHLSGSGGAMNWKDVLDYIAYGCTTVQLNAAILIHGSKVINQIKNDLRQYMVKHGFEELTEIRGITRKYAWAPSRRPEFINAGHDFLGKVVAEVDSDRCTGCGICVDRCLDDCISLRNNMAVIDESCCVGCQLCVLSCPVPGALKLKNMDLVEGLRQRLSGEKV